MSDSIGSAVETARVHQMDNKVIAEYLSNPEMISAVAFQEAKQVIDHASVKEKDVDGKTIWKSLSSVVVDVSEFDMTTTDHHDKQVFLYKKDKEVDRFILAFEDMHHTPLAIISA